MRCDFSTLIRHGRYLHLILALLFIIILMLSPLLDSGFVEDDATNSFINGNLQYAHQNLAQAIMDGIKSWMDMGRLFPIALINYHIIFTFFSDLIAYKLLIISSIVINVLLFGYFIRIITNSQSLGFASMLIMPIFFQFREYHDPIVGFSMLQQNVFLFIIISLIFLIFYLNGGNSNYLFISIVMYVLCILTYEIAILFFVLHISIMYMYRPDKNISAILKCCVPFLTIALIYILLIAMVQINLGISIIGGGHDAPPSRYPGIVPNINVEDILITFAKQNVAAFPLSYQMPRYLYQPPHTLYEILGLFNFVSIIIAVIYFVLCIVILKYVLRDILEEKFSGLVLWRLFIFGLLVQVLPSILVSLSSKYQKELYWGIGYLPVYISYFGVSIVTICIILFILTRLCQYNKNIIIIFIILIAMIISITGALTYTNNGKVIENLNQEWLYPRLIIEDALNDGLFKSVPDASLVLVDSSNPWLEQPGFYLMHSGVRLRSVESNGAYPKPYLSDNFPESALISSSSGVYSFRFSGPDNIFYLRYGSQSRGDGYAVLGKIADLQASNTSLYVVTARDLYFYIHWSNDSNPSREIRVEGIWARNDSALDYEPFVFAENELKLISSGKEWKLFAIPDTNRIINTGYLNIGAIDEHKGATYLIKSTDIKVISGFQGVEYWNGIKTRWIQADAILLVNSLKNKTEHLSLLAQSFYINRTLEIYLGNCLAGKTVVPTTFVNISIPLSLVKGANIIILHVAEGCDRPSDKPEMNSPDNRCLAVAVQNLTVI